MSDRKTAYVATIDKTEPIEGKDRIRYITLKDLGWAVIGGADLKPGDKVVYVEYDTIIADQPWAEFLRKRCYAPKYNGFKIRAMSMAGKISYGLILKGSECGVAISDKPDGYDLSEVLRVSAIDDAAEFESSQGQKKMTGWQRFVKKYAYFIWKALYGRKPTSGQFPSDGAIKTDETRIQTLNYLFKDEFKGMPLYVTEKIDGQSATFIYNKGRFIISSRNVKQYDQPIKKAMRELVPGNVLRLGKASAFVEIACKYKLPYYMVMWLKRQPYLKNRNELTLQGELAGPGIQGNKLQLNTSALFAFNLFDPKERRYYQWKYLENFCNWADVDHVPFKGYSTFHWANVKEMEDYVKEPFADSVYPEGQPREGLVFRARGDDSELYLPGAEHEQNGCFSWKCINPEFVLKEAK
jgi:hypothetical protein